MLPATSSVSRRSTSATRGGKVVSPLRLVGPPTPPASNELQLLDAYLPRGGVASGDELVAKVRPWLDQPLSHIARWIVGREVVHFRYGGETLLPLFQFDPATVVLLPAPRLLIQELKAALDDGGLAEWFVRPNVCLDGELPVDALRGGDAGPVLAAARAHRFMLLG